MLSSRVFVAGQCFLLALLQLRCVSGFVIDTSQVPLGCWVFGYEFDPLYILRDVPTTGYNVSSPLDCQKTCQQTANCSYFHFYDITDDCFLVGPHADLNLADPTNAGTVAGPKFCDPTPDACADLGPDSGWPGTSVASSQAAWDGQWQPTSLECWPRTEDGFPDMCNTSLSTVLEDTVGGWPGGCDDYQEVADLDTAAGETCQQRCYDSVLCAAWMTQKDGTGAERCYAAPTGTNCWKASATTPTRAQRVMHGSVKVLAPLVGFQVMNLTLAFGVNALGATSTDANNQLHCRYACISALICQYWQWSTKDGCFIDDPLQSLVGYPLVLDGVTVVKNSDTQQYFTAGEYIQHYCPAQGPAAIAAGSVSLAPFLTMLAVIMVISIVGGGAWYLQRERATKAAKLRQYGSPTALKGWGQHPHEAGGASYSDSEEGSFWGSPKPPHSVGDGRFPAPRGAHPGHGAQWQNATTMRLGHGGAQQPGAMGAYHQGQQRFAFW